jgi:hypothetical protein
MSASSGPMKLRGLFSVNLNGTASTGALATSNVTLSNNDASVSLSEIRYWIGNITGTSPYSLT